MAPFLPFPLSPTTSSARLRPRFSYSVAVNTRWYVTGAAAAVAVALAAACSAPHRTGDVEEIRRAGELRVAVRPGFLDAAGTRELSLQESALLRQFAARLGVEIRWIAARRGDRLLPHGPRGPCRRRGREDSQRSTLADNSLRASAALDWVDDLLIAFPDGAEAAAVSKVHLHRSALTPDLQAFLSARDLAFEEVPEEVSIEEVLDRVRSGRYRATIADSQIVNAVRSNGDLIVVDRVPVRRPIVWAVRDTNPTLQRAIDRFLFAESVLSRGGRARACRDLSRIRQSRVLRLVTRNSATTVTVERGGLAGFEYELALEFARELGVRLELSIPPPEVDPLRWLEEGYGDIAALHEPIAPEDEGMFRVSVPYRYVDLVSVVSARADPPVSVEELAGVRAMASRPGRSAGADDAAGGTDSCEAAECRGGRIQRRVVGGAGARAGGDRESRRGASCGCRTARTCRSARWSCRRFLWSGSSTRRPRSCTAGSTGFCNPRRPRAWYDSW